MRLVRTWPLQADDPAVYNRKRCSICGQVYESGERLVMDISGEHGWQWSVHFSCYTGKPDPLQETPFFKPSPN